MSKALHLCEGDILCKPEERVYARSLTIVDGLVHAMNQPPPKSSRIIKLGGQCAIPGFIDSHLHLTLGASGLGDVDLRNARSKEDFVSMLTAAAEGLQTGQWLVASGWSDRTLGASPDRTWLSSLPDIPTICFRMDLHTAVINDALIALLDTNRIANLPGGTLLHEGIIKEDALFDGVCSLMPPVSSIKSIARAKQAIREMHGNGITLIGTMEEKREIEQVLVPLQRARMIRLRVMTLDSPTHEMIAYCKTLASDPFLEVTGFKTFVDGSLGSRTAKMYDPWNDAKGDGVLTSIVEKGNLHSWAATVASSGFAPVIHAIGDRAVGIALDAIESIDQSVVPRIEHAQFISDRDLPRVKDTWFGVQPLHQPDDAAIGERSVGTERALQLHNWRRMIDANAKLSFGSDWPVAPPNPISAMTIAIKQGLTPHEALVASTQNGADSLRTPKAGRLEIGCFGDIAILDRDPLNCDWKKEAPSVTMTVLAGDIVFTKELNEA